MADLWDWLMRNWQAYASLLVLLYNTWLSWKAKQTSQSNSEALKILNGSPRR